MSVKRLEKQRAKPVTVNLDNIRAEADIELQYLDLQRQQVDARFAAAHLLAWLTRADDTMPEPGREDLKRCIVDLAAGLDLDTEGLADFLEPKCPFTLPAEEAGR